MKIVSVMTTASKGGAEYAAVDLLDGLAARGHEAILLSDQPAVRSSSVVIRQVRLGPKLSRSSWRSLALRWPWLILDLRAALEREAPYDVLLLHYKKEQLLARFLPARLRATLAWAEWGPVPYPLRRGVPRRAYVAAASQARTIMAVSASTRDSIVDVGVPPEKVEVVPNVMVTGSEGFSEAGRARVRSELGIPDDAFVVGCMSRLHPKKRNDVLVDAVVRMREDEGVHLLIAGDGETEAELRARAAPLGARAHFVPTPGPLAAEVVSAFDVSVFCPSPTEGAPRAVIVALLCGRPCVSTGPEGVADIITPEVGTIVTPEHDPEALARVLEAYRADPEGVRRLGAAARDLAARTYDVGVVTARIEALLTGDA